LGVSRRAIGEWENGKSYPKAHHLKHFIELALKQQVFKPGNEAEEIKALWRTARQKIVIDEGWLAQVLTTTAPPTASEPPSNPASVSSPQPANYITGPVVAAGPQVDWGEAPSILAFYGREAELTELRRWIVGENCRIVSLLGLGGIGKSSLVVNLMHQLAEHFEVVIWRSLRNAPPCETLLDGCLQILAPEMPSDTTPGLERRISLLLKHLQNRRVLLVLDNLETLLQEGHDVGHMRKGYEGYSLLLRQIAEAAHKSCMVLTSREKPVELVPLEGKRTPVRSLRLTQLDTAACEQLLLDKDIRGTSFEREQLSEIFSGNPLALKIVAQTIVDLFEGEIGLFLVQGEAIFGGVKKLLDQQFNRLSPMEQTVLMWLAILRETATLNELLAALFQPIPRTRLLEMLEALHRRSIIERGEKPGTFGLQSVVLEYLTLRLVEEVANELVQGPFLRLTEHSLLQAQAKDYVRQSQQRVIIAPLLTRLKGMDNNANRVESYLRKALERVHTTPNEQQGYVGGNILNLLIALGSDLAGWDFSGLNLWQVFLAGVELRNVNLAGADLRRSVFTQGFSTIAGLAYSPDGQFLAGGSQTGDIKVWHFNNQTENPDYSLDLEYRGHRNQVSAVVYSPNGRFLASASHDRTVRLWETRSGKNLLVFEGHTDTVRSVVFSPDGRLLASCSFDGTIRLWRVATGECLATLEGHAGWVWSVVFSPDGRLLASGSFDGTIILWEGSLANNIYKPLATLNGHPGGVLGLTFSPDGQTLYTCGADSTIRVWSVANHTLLRTLAGHVGEVQSIALSPDGATLASGGSDNSIRLWRTGSDKPYLTLSGHVAQVVELAFSPDGQTLASSSSDRSVRLWSVQDSEVLTTLQGYTNFIFAVAVNPNGSFFAAAASNNRIVLWQLVNQKLPLAEPLTSSMVLRGHTNEVLIVAISPQGNQLASAGWDATIKLWDISRVNENKKDQARLTLTGHTDNISSVAFNPTGNLLASGSADRTVRLWSTINGELIKTLEGHLAAVFTVMFSPDGSRIASGGRDGTIRLWDITTGQLTTSLKSDSIPIANLAYHPEGELLACGRYDGAVRVWQTGVDNQSPLILKGHAGTACWVAFSPDPASSALLASGGTDGTVRLWDIERGEELARFQHQLSVRSVAFTPDGKTVISAGSGGVVKLWDISSGELVATYRDVQPYEGVNITGVRGLTAAAKVTLLGLGAVED
jgi:WD40 repeat protein